VRLVLDHAVGHLDDQAARPAHQQRQRIMARNGMRLDSEAQDPQSVLEIVFPERGVPLEQSLGPPNVVDEDVEPPGIAVDPVDEFRNLRQFG
jgi:hypothetical protein